MSGYGLFQPATLGMQSQAHRLSTIGVNIANVNTGGFKRTDTEFETLLSDTSFQQSDLGGVKPYARSTNDVQGLITSTQGTLDLAITGDGFFAVQPEFSGATEVFFTRDGSFNVNTVDGQTSSVTSDDGATISVANGYLVDKNGYFLLGSAAEADGSFSSSAAAPMRVDQYAFTDTGQTTTTAALEINLPANNEFGSTAKHSHYAHMIQTLLNVTFHSISHRHKRKISGALMCVRTTSRRRHWAQAQQQQQALQLTGLLPLIHNSSLMPRRKQSSYPIRLQARPKTAPS